MQSKTAIGSCSTAELSVSLVAFLGKGNQEIIVILPAIQLIWPGLVTRIHKTAVKGSGKRVK